MRKTRREKKRFKKRTVVKILALLIIVGSFFAIMNNDYLAVRNVDVIGQKTLIEDDITEVVENYLKGSFLEVIPNDNLLVINAPTIENKLKEAFPKIENIDVEIDSGDTVVVNIGERSAHSLWCIDREYGSLFEEECYFADSEGLLYARAPYFSGSVYMKIYIPEYPEGNEIIGSNSLPVQDFDKLFDFLSLLEDEFAVNISYIRLTEFKDVYVYLARFQNTLYKEYEPAIIYNQSDDYKTIERNIGVVINFDDFKKDLTARPQALESIDVRFDGRVFYTFTPFGQSRNRYDESLEENQIPLEEEGEENRDEEPSE